MEMKVKKLLYQMFSFILLWNKNVPSSSSELWAMLVLPPYKVHNTHFRFQECTSQL